MSGYKLQIPYFNEERYFNVEIDLENPFENELGCVGFNKSICMIGNSVGVEVTVFENENDFICELKDCEDALFIFYCRGYIEKFECVERLMEIAKNITLSRTK